MSSTLYAFGIVDHHALLDEMLGSPSFLAALLLWDSSPTASSQSSLLALPLRVIVSLGLVLNPFIFI